MQDIHIGQTPFGSAMLPASNVLPRKPPPNLQLLCDVLREGICVNIHMSSLLKACTASCDSGAKCELSCALPAPCVTWSLDRTTILLPFPGALFICCLLVDQSLQLASCSSLSRVLVLRNQMCDRFCLYHVQYVFLTVYFHAKSSVSRMAVYWRCLGQVQLSIQAFRASSAAAVSQPGMSYFY